MGGWGPMFGTKSQKNVFFTPSLSNQCYALVLPKSILLFLAVRVREGFKKSKWKFKMAFAMKGGGLEGVSSATYLF